ncbi:MAG: hypothetical protein ACOCWV_01640 [Planctomycetota bacterium]
MKRTMLPILAALLVGAVLTVMTIPAGARDASDTQADSDVTLEVAGLSVAKPRPNDKYNRSMAFGLPRGTAVHFAIDGGERYFIEMDKDQSQLQTFTDDKGTVLAKPSKASAFGNKWMPFSPNISDDGNQVFFSVRSKKLPADGTKTLRVKGTFTLLAGKGEKNAKSEFTLKDGEAVKLGTIDATLENVKESSFGRTKAALTLKSNSSFAAIRSVVFHDTEGNEVKSRRMGSYSTGPGGKKTYGLSFGLEKELVGKKVRVKVTYFSKVENVVVNVDEKIDLGL